MEVVRAVPTALNAMLSGGELDVAAISAAHWLEHRDAFVRVGDLGIVADGPVRSVLLVAPMPPALLVTQPIAATAQSASGRALLAAILRGIHGFEPVFETVDDALGAARAGRPALIIGDDALEARATLPQRRVHDLGECWREWQGLPMTFAVWAARAEIAREHPEELAALTAALIASRAWGAARPDAIIDAAVARRPAHRAFYADYFTRLSYTIDARAEVGLERFASLCHPDSVNQTELVEGRPLA